jgi:guanyl-specific ribonuclease Sa
LSELTDKPKPPEVTESREIMQRGEQGNEQSVFDDDERPRWSEAEGSNVVRTEDASATGVLRDIRETPEADRVLGEVGPTLERIESGVTYPHRNDGSRFENRAETLPVKANEDYYTEYVHPTPGVDHAGEQRVVTGNEGEVYYTSDHYKNFVRLK